MTGPSRHVASSIKRQPVVGARPSGVLDPVEAALVLMLREIARNRAAEHSRRRATLTIVEDPR